MPTLMHRCQMTRASLIGAAILGFLGPALTARATDPLPPLVPLDAQTTLYHDVTVVPMHQPGVMEHHSVLITDGVISRVEPASELTPETAPPGTRIIDGANGWLIPGLADMHVHLPPYDTNNTATVEASKRACTLLLANGVTTARGMVGHPTQVALRTSIIAGQTLGPTLYLAGPPIHAGVAKTPEQAVDLVRLHKEQGFDLIKSHRVISPETYRAVQTTAAEIGIAVAGHVDNEVGLDVALEFSQQIEHLDAIPAALLRDAAQAPTFGQFPPGPVLEGLDTARLPLVAGRLAARKMWCTPTLALFAQILDQRTPTAELMARRELRYISAPSVGSWAEQRNGMKFPADWGIDYGDRVVGLRGAITKALHDAGVGLMAGSDSPQAFMVTGFSLHAELRALVDAGLTPWESLRCATSNPAAYLTTLPGKGSAASVEPNFGTIQMGSRADLVLLDADPLAEIANTSKIRSVMLRGKLYDRATLDAMLADVERSARPQAP